MSMDGYEINDDPDYEMPDGFNSDSPEIRPGLGNREYWELDDYENETMVNPEYTPYTVTEIIPDKRTRYNSGLLEWQDGVTNKRNFDWSSKMFTEIDGTTVEYKYENNIYDRDLLLDNDKSSLTKPVPIIMMYDGQKGTFGHVYVVTNGEDFDPKKFAYTSITNTMSNGIDGYYYDKQQLDVDTNELSTWGKGFYASVGYVEQEELAYNHEALLEEGWNNLESET